MPGRRYAARAFPARFCPLRWSFPHEILVERAVADFESQSAPGRRFVEGAIKMHIRTLRGRLPLGFVILVAGCTAQQNLKYDTAEVSGKITFKQQPVTGGRVTFVSDVGGLAESAVIDNNGNYKLMAPVGPVHITVDNSMLTKRGARGGPLLHKPDGEAPSPMTGTFVPFSTKYYNVNTTDLTFTVDSSGPQTHDIPLE
jgi:hypothetical protein